MGLKRMQELAGIEPKQSPIDWLVEEMSKYGYAHTFKLYQKQVEQAKQMEKERMIEFAKKCSTESTPDEYYEEMYNDIF